jgi:RimJ/RimL family protein N-acetyltransferase
LATSRSKREVPKMLVALRADSIDDDDTLFEYMRDPESVWMAAFTSEDPSDRAAFDAWRSRNQSNDEVTMRAITCDGELVGSIASFVVDGDTEISYWIGREHWGQGIASQALAMFLSEVADRLIRARAASDNIASRRVLEKAGFVVIGTEESFAAGRGQVIEETIMERRT